MNICKKKDEKETEQSIPRQTKQITRNKILYKGFWAKKVRNEDRKILYKQATFYLVYLGAK